MKNWQWPIVVVVGLSLVALAFKYGIISEQVRANSLGVASITETLRKIDTNQQLLTQRLENHVEKEKH